MSIIKDKNKWDSLLSQEFKDYNDVFFTYNYFKLYAKHYEAESEGIFWEDKNIKIFWTHLIRDINRIQQFKDFKYYDLTTPYGYGGPLIFIKTEDKEKINKSLKEFFKEYKDYALKNKYVCEFIRFHPVFGDWEFLDEIFNVEHLNDVVIVNLKEDLEKIWIDIKKGHKYNIKKSTKEGCEVKITNEPRKEDIDNFIKIYYQAMDKNQATKKYYFSAEFIEDHFKLLNTILIEAKYKNKVIGTSLFIYGDKIIHYHLSGAIDDFPGLYPSDLILWEAIKWAKEKNFEIIHLGGGRGKNDSLFEFKKGFSDLIKPFKVGKIIFNVDVYDKLNKMNSGRISGDYFPKYREGFDEKII